MRGWQRRRDKGFLSGAWRTTSKVVGSGGWGVVGKPGFQTGGRVQRWVLEVGVSACGGANPLDLDRDRLQDRDCRERMAKGSKGRVYLQQVFPPGTDKTRGGEVLCSRWVQRGPQKDTIHSPPTTSTTHKQAIFTCHFYMLVRKCTHFIEVCARCIKNVLVTDFLLQCEKWYIFFVPASR